MEYEQPWNMGKILLEYFVDMITKKMKSAGYRCI